MTFRPTLTQRLLPAACLALSGWSLSAAAQEDEAATEEAAPAGEEEAEAPAPATESAPDDTPESEAGMPPEPEDEPVEAPEMDAEEEEAPEPEPEPAEAPEEEEEEETATSSIETPQIPAGIVERIGIPGSDFPISMAAYTAGNVETLYVSGIVPQVVNEDADPNSRQAYGNTRRQTITVLEEMKSRLENMGWSLGDIVMMRVYLVGDEKTDGRLDFAGFMEGYSQFFGTEEQPNKPARAVVEVAGLIRPGWRVEIEAQAARVIGE